MENRSENIEVTHMVVGLRHNFFAARAVFVMLSSVMCSHGQSAQPEKPPMADDVFKNVQTLKGLTVDQFMSTMGFISAALNMNCADCHDTSSIAGFALESPNKRTARRMIAMVNGINKNSFGGKRAVTCYSCHRADPRPRVIPRLSDQYGMPPPEEPNEVEPRERSAPNAPTAEQIFARYIQALGGPQRVASLTSFVGHGNYEGFDTGGDKVPVDVYAKAPSQRTTVVHLTAGDNVRTFDGKNYWTTAAGTFLPIPVLVMSGGELEGARLDAALTFPAQIQQILKNWRTGFPATTVDDVDVDVVQGTGADNMPVKLFFDKKSGLLIRQVRFADATLGLIPAQIDYTDYRDVAGVKLPFHWTVTWTDGRSTIDLAAVEPNVAIDTARFAKPLPAARRAQ